MIDVSVTVAVHVVAWLISTDDSEQLIAMIVEFLPNENDPDPWLAK